MVKLTKIYTRTGDDGTTNLGDMSTTSKLDLRLAAYADVDESNSHLGVVIALGALPDDVVAVLTHVQNDLFDVGADLSCPIAENPEHPQLRVEPDYIERLEGWCDQYNESLEKLRSFILPGGTLTAAELHVARTVTRRAERSAWAAIEEHGATMNVLTAKYLNRLSDLLFILARYANREPGDVLWVPGGERLEPARASFPIDGQRGGRARTMMMLRCGVGGGGHTHGGDGSDEGSDNEALDHDELSPSAGGPDCPPALGRFCPPGPIASTAPVLVRARC